MAAQLPYVPRTLALVWIAARGWTAAWIVVLLAQGILPVATVYLTRTVVNRLMPAIRAGGSWDSLQPLVSAAALMGLVLLASEALRGAAGWLVLRLAAVGERGGGGGAAVRFAGAFPLGVRSIAAKTTR